MKKICLLIMIWMVALSAVCCAYQVDETKWERIEADCDLFYETTTVTRENGVCQMTVLMATKGDAKYLISDYQIYRDTRTIVTVKHDIYDYETDRKVHTVRYPSYSPKHIPLQLHDVGEELYRVAWPEK